MKNGIEEQGKGGNSRGQLTSYGNILLKSHLKYIEFKWSYQIIEEQYSNCTYVTKLNI